jgi:hypothetical protein
MKHTSIYSLLLIPLFIVVLLVPAGQALAYTYTYTAYDFGLDASSHNWQVWSANGSNVYNWSQNYVGGYLHYTFTIQDYGGGFYCSASCRGLFVYDKDPSTGFETSDILTNEGIGAPQNNMNNHTYAVDIQFNSTGYHESVYDNNTSTEYSDADVSITVTPTTYIALAWNGTGGYGATESPSDHAAAFGSTGYAFPSGQGGGSDIYTTPLPIQGGSGGGTNACSTGSLGTCISDVVPTTGTTTATSTSVGATVYVNPSDYKSGMTLNMEFYSPTQAAVGDFVIQAVDQNVSGADNKTISIPLTSGLNTISTTTEFMAVGHWLGTYSVDSPTFFSQLWLIGSLFSPNILAQVKNDFIVVASTGLDSAIAQGGAAITTYLTTGTTTNSSGQSIDVLNCNPGSGFSLTACLVSIVIPSATSTSAFITGFQGTFLQRVPFGYITRFVTILNTTSTSTLPGLVVTLPPKFPGAGETFDLTPWNELMSSTTMLSTATSSSGDGKTFRQIVEPGWDILVLSIFTFFIVHRLLGIDAQKDSKNTT